MDEMLLVNQVTCYNGEELQTDLCQSFIFKINTPVISLIFSENSSYLLLITVI